MNKLCKIIQEASTFYPLSFMPNLFNTAQKPKGVTDLSFAKILPKVCN